MSGTLITIVVSEQGASWVITMRIGSKAGQALASGGRCDFLAHKLDLDEKQITELVRILDELKTERAQAEVDDRRALAEFADAVAGDVFDAAKAQNAGERRVQSTAKVRDTLIRSLQQIHALLTAEQRQRLAYMIRSGILTV